MSQRWSVGEIERLDDPLLLPWLELYETAFPPEERDLVAAILATLAPGAASPRESHLLAAVDRQGAFAGLAMYEAGPGAASADLYYLATAPSARNQGLGAELFAEVVWRVAALAVPLLFLEVEIPERGETAERQALAARRMAFYRRLGCRQLLNIAYLQYVGSHQQPIPMHLLVYPLVELSVAEIFARAQVAFADWLVLTGTPALA